MIWRKIKPETAVRLIRFYPPFLAAGVKVSDIDKDFTTIDVEMKLTFYNVNYVGTHFGGSLYAMCDPFYMFILLYHLKKDHVVWDKAASIDFIKPGVGKVRAHFHISLEQIENFKQQALKEFKLLPVFETKVIDERGETVAIVKKTLYIRRKDAKERFKKPQTS